MYLFLPNRSGRSTAGKKKPALTFLDTTRLERGDNLHDDGEWERREICSVGRGEEKRKI